MSRIFVPAQGAGFVGNQFAKFEVCLQNLEAKKKERNETTAGKTPPSTLRHELTVRASAIGTVFLAFVDSMLVHTAFALAKTVAAPVQHAISYFKEEDFPENAGFKSAFDHVKKIVNLMGYAVSAFFVAPARPQIVYLLGKFFEVTIEIQPPKSSSKPSRTPAPSEG